MSEPSHPQPGDPYLTHTSAGGRYLGAIRDNIVLIALTVVIAVSVAAIVTFTAEKKYTAHSDLLVTPVSGSDDRYLGTSVLREGSSLSSAPLTASRIITAPEIVAAAAKTVGNGFTRADLLAATSVQPLTQSDILVVQATASRPELASAIANALPEALIANRQALFRSELSRMIAELTARAETVGLDSAEAADIRARLVELRLVRSAGDPTLTISSKAVSPTTASSPKPKLALTVALVVSLLIGTAIALAREISTPRISRLDDLLETQRLPILARVPRITKRRFSRYLAGIDDLPPPAMEAYRTLRASLALANDQGQFPKTVLVTSASPNDGKTLTAVNLAIALSQAGVRVVLVDADLRRPMVATYLRAPIPRNTIGRVLRQEIRPADAVVPAPEHKRLDLLLAGYEDGHPVDLLQRHRIDSMLEQLKRQADVVVIDSPPLGEVSDAIPLADAVERILVCVRLGHTRLDKLNDLRRLLSSRNVTPAGFVVTLNRDAPPSGGDYYYVQPPQTDRRVTSMPSRQSSENPSQTLVASREAARGSTAD